MQAKQLHPTQITGEGFWSNWRGVARSEKSRTGDRVGEDALGWKQLAAQNGGLRLEGCERCDRKKAKAEKQLKSFRAWSTLVGFE